MLKFISLKVFLIFLLVPVTGYTLPNCNGKFHNCIGEFTYKSGSSYFGEWLNNKRNGKGVLTWKNGDKYSGDHVNNLRSGYGTYIWKNGNKYEGQFINNKRTGFGTYIWKSGVKYEGQFKDGNRTGEGIVTFKDGTKQEGVFKDGKFILAKKISPIKKTIKSTNDITAALNKEPIRILTKKKKNINKTFDWLQESEKENKINENKQKANTEILINNAKLELKACNYLSKKNFLSNRFLEEVGLKFKVNPSSVSVSNIRYVPLFGCTATLFHNRGASTCTIEFKNKTIRGIGLCQQ